MRRLLRFPSAGVLLLMAACGGSDSPPAATALPTAALSASQTAVANGSASMLTWSSTNATSCTAAGGWSGTLPASGTRSTGALSANTSYSLTCSGQGSTSAAASVLVNVVPTATLTVSSSTIPVGSASVLTWSSTNATSCTAAGGWSGTLPASGTQSTGTLSANSSYSLSCTGPGGTSGAASVSIYAVPAATAALAATPTVVATGSAAVLTWSSTNATSCTASGGWSGTRSPSGTLSTGPLAASTSYSLICTGTGGTSSPATVTVVSGSVSLVPAVAALTVSQTQQFTATLPGSGGAAWTVDGIAGGNGTVGAVSASGLYTAGSAAGSHTIVAASIANPSLSVSAVAAVTDLAGVYTYHNDVARDGTNAQEYALTTSNVNTTSFGKLFACTADGAIYAQPLWVANLTINGAQHNTVFVATEHDGLFAFDADANPCVELWSVSLIDGAHGASSGETTVPAGTTGFLVGLGGGDLTPEVGVTGTPVIDPSTNTLYVVSKSVDSAQTTFYQRLHAIDLATGNEKAGSPVTIAATYPGTGDGGATVSFDPQPENQRAALAFVGGVVYVTWAAHEDASPWYGWVMGYSYNGASFTQTAVFNADPDSQGGGVWMGGGAPAADSNGNLYLVTGNGNFNATSGVAANSEYGDSLLQLTGALAVSQYFTPSDELADKTNDADFGAGGAALLADLPAGDAVTHLLLCGGKDGSLYVLNRDSLGGFGDGAAVQKIGFGYPIFATGAYWNSYFYLGGNRGPLSAYLLSPSIPQLTLASSSAQIFGFGGTTPSVSAAASQNGIVWGIDNTQYCTNHSPGCGPAVLHAYDAANVANELWNSAMAATDAAGNAIKFTVPTIANGKVYLGTRGNNSGGLYGSTAVSGELDVYGLKAD